MDTIALVSSPSRAHSRRPPLALMTIAAYLERHGFNAEILDFKIKSYTPLKNVSAENFIIEKILSRLEKMNPLAVALTAFSHEIESTIALASLIKSRTKSFVIVGGNHATYYPNHFLYKGSPVDFVVIGEGEVTFTDLLKALSGKKKPDSVQSIAFFKSGKIIKTPQRDLIQNLDDLPIPAFEKVDMAFYTKPHLYGIRYLPLSIFYVFTTRGCPWVCTFCSIPDIWKHNKGIRRIRYKSANAVADEVETLVKKYGVDAIYFFDDDFCVWRQRVIDMCNEFKKRQIDFLWGCETRVDEIDDELARIMSEAGCIQIDFGVESGSQKMLDTIDKRTTVAQNLEAFRLCKKHGIRTFANLMFNLPGETVQDVEETVSMAKEINATVYSIGSLTPFPGSEIFKQLKLNLEVKDFSVYREATHGEDSFRLANHNLDLTKLVADTMRSVNRPFSTFREKRAFMKYMKKVARARRKKDYTISFIRLTHFALTSRIPRVLKGRLSPYK